MNRFIKIFLLLMLGLTSVLGQSKGKERLFSCLVWDDLGVGEVLYFDGADYQELSFAGKKRSDYYPIPVGDTFRLFTEKEVNGEVVYEVIGETLINIKSKRLLLIIVRNPESATNADALPLRILVLDDSIRSFPGGSTKFINLTPQPLTAEINDTTAVVESQGAKIIRPSIPKNGGFVPLFIRYGEMELYGTRIFCQKGERRIMFMRVNPEKDPRRPILIDFLPQIVGPSFTDD